MEGVGMPEVPTREIFRNFPLAVQLLFYLIAAVSSLVFLYGFYRRVQKYRRGRPEPRFDHLGQRIARAAGVIARNSTIWHRDTYAGLSHTFIFWGFVILFIGTVLVFLDHDILRFFGLHLLQGSFYLGFSVVLDIFGVIFLVGIVMMMVRRGFWGLPQLDYRRADPRDDSVDRSGYHWDDRIFLTLLFLIGVTGFLIEGFRIAADRPSFEVWSPVGWALADLTDVLGLTAAADQWHLATWWVHAVLVMVFIAYIPFSKAMHMLIDIANLVFTDDKAARRLPSLVTDGDQMGMGYANLVDLTWKELLDLDACTKCGRCHVSCPARAAGTTLSPRDLILDLRTYADSTFGISEWFRQKWPQNGANGADLAKEVIGPSTLWACTTCMACVEACPVGIEHLTHIVQMRRHLVDEGIMDDNLQTALMNLGDYGNSFGQPERTRGKWTQGLSFKIKDARKEPAQYLWYVGDYASFDPRLQEISRTVARVLHQAGVDFGILYDGEKNAGNDARRVGEEGLFEMLVEDNVAALQRAKFKEIFTTDPHTLNTLRNEYPEFGADYVVHHYTGLLARLIDEGKLKFSKQLGYKVTYHDPCYLARYNRETDAPRRVMQALGLELIEMPRCRDNTFCCGAGGGRIWMDDSDIQERPSEMRIKEALSLDGVQLFLTACPKDYTMYTDAVKTSGNEGRIEVKDIIELVEEAMAEEETEVEVAGV
jgi:Fe-S oxidoreductase/nitrate reductase gamma subunit